MFNKIEIVFVCMILFQKKLGLNFLNFFRFSLFYVEQFDDAIWILINYYEIFLF